MSLLNNNGCIYQLTSVYNAQIDYNETYQLTCKFDNLGFLLGKEDNFCVDSSFLQ